MDIKIERERILTICHGCLSADRKLTRITGQNKALFVKLRGDAQQSEDDAKELQLCWECYALLNKVKHFQACIKAAQCRLIRCLHTLYDKNDLPHTLSHLKISKQENQYDYKYKFIYEEEQKSLIPVKKYRIPEQKNLICEQIELTEHKDLVIEPTDSDKLIQDIKQENNDSIKEEYENISNDNDTDYYETEFKLERDENYKVVYNKLHKKKSAKRSIKQYVQYATITTKNDLNLKEAIGLYSKTVYLTEKEVEKVLDRERRCRSFRQLPFKCKKCKLGYKKQLDLLRHKTFHHSEPGFPTTCKSCKCMLHSASELEEHWRDRHTPMLQCSMCSELCKSKGEMRKHLNRTHSNSYTCNNCQMQFRTLREFSDHYKIVHERFICDYCNSSFASKRRLETHIKRNHLPLYCSVCNRNYRTYHVLESHVKTTHPELVSCDIRKELCYCVECDKQFPTIYKYRRHLQQSVRHTPPKKIRVPCPDCNKVFTRVTYMNNHYRLVHVKESKHYCQLCNKYFANGYGVRKHIQYVHQKVAHAKDKICDLCGRGFSTNRILANHRRTHTGERPYKCRYCPATFAQDTARKSHQKTQHKNFMSLHTDTIISS